MKRLRIAAALLAAGSGLLLAGSIYADTNVWSNDSTNICSINTWRVSTDLTIGPVTICTTNGVVKIKEGVALDEASRAFWKAVSDAYPAMFETVKKK
jgi:hypothetical protein